MSIISITSIAALALLAAAVIVVRISNNTTVYSYDFAKLYSGGNKM